MIPRQIIQDFAKIVIDESNNKKDNIKYGTVKDISNENNQAYVVIDGSNVLTPVTYTVVVSLNDRVIIEIQNHKAIVTGNLTNPAAKSTDVESIKKDVEKLDPAKIDKLIEDMNSKLSKEEAKSLYVSKTDYLKTFQNNTLWSGDSLLDSTDSISLSVSIENVQKGLVLIFEQTINAETNEGICTSYFIPKYSVGLPFIFSGMSYDFSKIWTKKFSINDNKILGNSDNIKKSADGNPIPFDNTICKLKYVIGI